MGPKKPSRDSSFTEGIILWNGRVEMFRKSESHVKGMFTNTSINVNRVLSGKVGTSPSRLCIMILPFAPLSSCLLLFMTVKSLIKCSVRLIRKCGCKVFHEDYVQTNKHWKVLPRRSNSYQLHPYYLKQFFAQGQGCGHAYWATGRNQLLPDSLNANLGG